MDLAISGGISCFYFRTIHPSLAEINRGLDVLMHRGHNHIKHMAYDQTNPKSIEEYGKKLVGKTLRQALERLSVVHDFRGKGSFGQFLEGYYFGIHPGNSSAPDFKEAGVELKSFPLKQIKKGLVAKERLVLGMIDYMTLPSEKWETSSFLKKNSDLMLVGFLHQEAANFLDYLIKIAQLWKFPAEDIEIIREDWNKIVAKVRDGKAHELSEGDTLYLGACTKGADATGRREQPNSEEPAKPRALCLKQAYVNAIIGRTLTGAERVVKDVGQLRKTASFEDLVKARFDRLADKSISEIHTMLGLGAVPGKISKSHYATLARRMMGVKGQKIEEFEKAGVVMKTIRLEKNGIPKESMSFPAFKYKELVKETWDESVFKEMLEQRFFFVIYQKDEKDILRFKKVKFWTIPHHDLEVEVKHVWEETVKRIKAGQASKLPGQSENPIAHIRPHAANSADTDVTPQGMQVTKKCFWLNREYLSTIIT